MNFTLWTMYEKHIYKISPNICIPRSMLYVCFTVLCLSHGKYFVGCSCTVWSDTWRHFSHVIILGGVSVWSVLASLAIFLSLNQKPLLGILCFLCRWCSHFSSSSMENIPTSSCNFIFHHILVSWNLEKCIFYVGTYLFTFCNIISGYMTIAGI